MSYSSIQDYELARARKFIASMSGSGRYSVSIRRPKPSRSNPGYPYYVLVEKFENGSTKTVNKAHSIDELMAYFTADNSMAAALWVNTKPDQPVVKDKVFESNTTTSRNSGMESLFDGVKVDTSLRKFTLAEQKKIKLALKQAQTFLRQQGFIGKYVVGYSNIPNDKLYYLNTKNVFNGKTLNIAAANGMDELMSYFWTHLDPDYKRMWELAKKSVKA